MPYFHRKALRWGRANFWPEAIIGLFQRYSVNNMAQSTHNLALHLINFSLRTKLTGELFRSAAVK